MSRAILYVTLPLSLAVVVGAALLAGADEHGLSPTRAEQVAVTVGGEVPCSGPAPQDMRIYYGPNPPGDASVILEAEEGGFIVTDIIAQAIGGTGNYVHLEVWMGGEFAYDLTRLPSTNMLGNGLVIQPKTGILLPAGAELRGMGGNITVIGYVLPVSCTADLDGSGAVDATDLANLLGAWGPCS